MNNADGVDVSPPSIENKIAFLNKMINRYLWPQLFVNCKLAWVVVLLNGYSMFQFGNYPFPGLLNLIVALGYGVWLAVRAYDLYQAKTVPGNAVEFSVPIKQKDVELLAFFLPAEDLEVLQRIVRNDGNHSRLMHIEHIVLMRGSLTNQLTKSHLLHQDNLITEAINGKRQTP